MRTLLAVVGMAASLAGCSSVKVHTEYDPKASFAGYRTYAWNPAPAGPDQAPTARDPAVRAMVVAAIDREMARKGLVKVAIDADPSFIVTALGWAEGRTEVSNYGYTYAGSYVGGPYGAYPVATPAVKVREYQVGTLLLDFADARTKQLFWRGVASDTIDDVSTIRKRIDEVARKLLESYPPSRN